MSSGLENLSKDALGNGFSEDFGRSQGESFAGFHRSGIESQNEFVKVGISTIVTVAVATMITINTENEFTFLLLFCCFSR